MRAREHHHYSLPDIAPSIALAQARRYEATHGFRRYRPFYGSLAVAGAAMTAAPVLRCALMAGCLLVLGIVLT